MNAMTARDTKLGYRRLIGFARAGTKTEAKHMKHMTAAGH